MAANPCQAQLQTADSDRYTHVGYGYLFVPAPTQDGYIDAFC